MNAPNDDARGYVLCLVPDYVDRRCNELSRVALWTAALRTDVTPPTFKSLTALGCPAFVESIRRNPSAKLGDSDSSSAVRNIHQRWNHVNPSI